MIAVGAVATLDAPKIHSTMQDVVIACELGPNPAPITELIWALRSQRQRRAGRGSAGGLLLPRSTRSL
ncbi:MAG: hypothetical protein ACI9MC_003515 [Kiritimatiellia bacterium]|jgi:hypothetical protein